MNSLHPIVPGCGELDSTLIVLGERPGVNEMRARQPFVGKTGEVVQESLGGWDRVRRTNVRCFFDEHESPARKGRSYDECRAHLQAEFDSLTAARTILCLGADAARLIVGRDDVTRLHGATFTRAEADAMRNATVAPAFRLPAAIHSVVVSFHPAYAMRGMPQQMPWIRKAIGDARRLSNAPAFARPEFEMILEPTIEQAAAYIRRSKAPLSIDIETPRDNATKIQLVGVSDSAYSACVFPWGEGYIELMAEVLQDTERLKFGHNFAYDLRAFMANGIEPWNPVCDTIQAEALPCPPFKEAKKRRWLALSTCIARRVDGWSYHKEPEHPATKAMLGAWFPNVPEWLHYRLYCGLDAAGTWLLEQGQIKTLQAQGMFELFSEIVSPAGLALCYMEAHGIPVDEKRRALLRTQTEEAINGFNFRIEAIVRERHAARKARIEEAILAAEAERGLLRSRAGFCAEHPAYNGLTKRSVCAGCQRAFQRSVGEREKDKRLGTRLAAGRTKLKQVGDGFKADNDNHWRWFLFDMVTGLGLLPVRETETGLPGVGEEDIEELQRLYPEVEVLKERVGLQHALHRLRFVLSVPVDARGRAHFTFSLHRTENGRVSSGLDDDEDDKVRVSDGGNAQNIKEEDRQIYCAEPGFVLIEHDLEQVELRVMAWLAKDFDLLRALREGRDLHAENAAAVFGCEVKDARTYKVYFEGAWQSARRAVKRATHGWDYGLGDKKAGAMFQPWAGKSAGEAAEYLLYKKVLTIESWKRRLKAAERAQDAAGEMRKLRLRMVELANTITAKRWREGYFRKWPGLAKFQARVVAEVEEKGVLTNPFGRTLRFWNYHFDKDARRWVLSDREEALAFLPASSVGDMVKKMLPEVAIVAKDHGGALLTTTHDSFLSMIPLHPDNVWGYYNDMATILSRDWWEFETLPEFGRLVIPSKATIGYNWGPQSESNPDGLRDYESEKWKEGADCATRTGERAIRGS